MKYNKQSHDKYFFKTKYNMETSWATSWEQQNDLGYIY